MRWNASTFHLLITLQRCNDMIHINPTPTSAEIQRHKAEDRIIKVIDQGRAKQRDTLKQVQYAALKKAKMFYSDLYPSHFSDLRKEKKLLAQMDMEIDIEVRQECRKNGWPIPRMKRSSKIIELR